MDLQAGYLAGYLDICACSGRSKVDQLPLFHFHIIGDGKNQPNNRVLYANYKDSY